VREKRSRLGAARASELAKRRVEAAPPGWTEVDNSQGRGNGSTRVLGFAQGIGA